MTPAMKAAWAAFVALGSLRLWLTLRGSKEPVGETKDGTAVFIRKKGRFRELVFSRNGQELVQSRSDRKHAFLSGPGYVEGLHVGMLLDERPKRVLFLGGGACIAPRQFEIAYSDVSIDVVEREPLVIAAASRHFGFKVTKNVAVHVADARKFVRELPYGPYDLVVFDCYDATGIPRELTTSDFFASLHAIAPALVANFVRGSGVEAAVKEAYSEAQIAVFSTKENEIVLAAPVIPDAKMMAARAEAAVGVAPTLPAILETRRSLQ